MFSSDWSRSGVGFSFSALLGALLLLACPLADASSAVTAHVLKFGTYGNGNVYVALDQTINEPGCPLPYLEMLQGSAAAQSVLSSAAIAFSTGSSITVQTDACLNGSPSFSGARGAYLIVNSGT